MKPWLQYTLVRLVSFAVALGVLLLVDVEWWLAAILAAVIGLCVSYIFFGKLRDAVARDFAERRAAPPEDSDADVEDADVDSRAEAAPHAEVTPRPEVTPHADAADPRGEARP